MDEVQRDEALEGRIAEWRAFLLKRGAMQDSDADELEDHLRSQVSALAAGPLSVDEAFLIAVKRLGDQDAVTGEFARVHSERLWKQAAPARGVGGAVRTEARVVAGLAAAAAAAVQVPKLLGFDMEADDVVYFRNLCFYVLPFLAGYFAWKRRLPLARCAGLAAVFAAALVLVNAYPFNQSGSTIVLTVLHLPIALWLAVGIAYTGGRWSDLAERMNFVRFSGELVIYYVLIAISGGVLTGFTVNMFGFIGINVEDLAVEWLLFSGAAGAVIVAAALVELKKSVVENMAPVLTHLFAPMFALVLLTFLATMTWTRSALVLDRGVLIGFDLLLTLVLCLVLYAVSARDSLARPGIFDRVVLLLVACALVVDAVMMAAIASRILEYGSSPNKLAALGENLILLVNLLWTAWLYFQFVRGRGAFASIERWQTAYLPVYSVWAAFVVVAFPPLFGFA